VYFNETAACSYKYIERWNHPIHEIGWSHFVAPTTLHGYKESKEYVTRRNTRLSYLLHLKCDIGIRLDLRGI